MKLVDENPRLKRQLEIAAANEKISFPDFVLSRIEKVTQP